MGCRAISSRLNTYGVFGRWSLFTVAPLVLRSNLRDAVVSCQHITVVDKAGSVRTSAAVSIARRAHWRPSLYNPCKEPTSSTTLLCAARRPAFCYLQRLSREVRQHTALTARYNSCQRISNARMNCGLRLEHRHCILSVQSAGPKLTSAMQVLKCTPFMPTQSKAPAGSLKSHFVRGNNTAGFTKKGQVQSQFCCLSLT